MAACVDYDVFISYKSEDLKYAEEVNDHLLLAGFSVWFDKSRLQAGHDWYNEIAEGCEASRMVVAILTPRWKQSLWTRYETYAHEEVIPLWFEGNSEEVFTPPMRRFQAVKCEGGEVPDWAALTESIRRILDKPKIENLHRVIQMRYGRATHFVGREDNLTELHEKLWGSAGPLMSYGRVQIVSALGGVGKTTLVREYAEQYWRLYRQIFWVDCRMDLESQFAHIHDLLFPEKSGERAEQKEKARLAFEELNQREPQRLPVPAHAGDEECEGRAQRLLVLDDARDEEQVQQWIPRTGQCHTMITSRFAGFSNPGEVSLLNVLGEGPSCDLLLKRSARVWEGLDPAEQDAVIALAKRLGYLPLALEQAAAYMSQGTRSSFAKYLELLKESSLHFLKMKASRGSTEYPESVYGTWRTTIDCLPAGARTILRLAGFMATAPIPCKLWIEARQVVERRAKQLASDAEEQMGDAAEGTGEAEIRDWIGKLEEYSMVQMSGEGESSEFAVHGLVQEVERWATEPSSRGEWVDESVEAFTTFAPANSIPYEVRPAWQKLLPHGEALSERLKEFGGTDNLALFQGVGLFLYMQGAYDRANLILTRALEANEKLHGENHIDTLTSAFNAASARFNIGELDSAAGLFQRVLAEGEAKEELQPTLVSCLRRLAQVMSWKGEPDSAKRYLERASELARSVRLEKKGEYAQLELEAGHFAEAERLYRQALEENLLDETHPETLKLRVGLASVRYSLADYEFAEREFRRSLILCEESLGEDDPMTLEVHGSLAQVLQARGDLAGAGPLFQRTYERCEQVLPPKNQTTLTNMRGWGVWLYTKGEYERAEPLFKKMLERQEQLTGHDHLYTLTVKNNLGIVYVARDNGVGAEKLFNETLTDSERVLGRDHPQTLVSVTQLGLLLYKRGEYALAEPMLERVLQANERLLGPEHPDTLTSVNNLALARQELGDRGGAEMLLRRALSGREKGLAPDHSDTLVSASSLAMLLNAKGDSEEAHPLFERALAGNERLLGAKHPTTLANMNSMGSYFYANERFAEAEKYFRRALAGMEEVLGPQHQETLTSANHLALSLAAQNKDAEAEMLLLRVLDAADRLGKDHSVVLTATSGLADVLRRKGDESAERVYRELLARQEKALRPEHPNTLRTVATLGVLLADKQANAEAEKYYRRALAGQEKVLGPQHRDTLTSVNNLALLLAAQNKDAEAEMLLRRVLDVADRLGKDHPAVMRATSGLADALWKRGDESAEQMYRDLLEHQEKVLGPENPNTLLTADALGAVLRKRGEFVRAEPLHRRVLEWREQKLGRNHSDTRVAANNLGVVLYSLGDLPGAKELYEQALEGQERVPGLTDPSTVQTMENLALLFEANKDDAGAEASTGDLEGAQTLYEHLLESRERTFGHVHEKTLETADALGTVLRKRGEFVRAEPLYRRVLDWREQKLGRNHSDTRVAANNLGVVLYSLGDLPGAKELYEQALEGQERVPELTDPSTMQTMENLALLLEAKKDDAGAEAIWRQLVVVREAFGADDARTLAAINSLALVLRRRNDYAAAEGLYRRVLETRERKLGKDHADTLASVNLLGVVLYSRQNYAEAEEVYRRALIGQERVHGPEHAATLQTMNNLALLLEAQEDLDGAERLFRESAGGTRRDFGPGSSQHAFDTGFSGWPAPPNGAGRRGPDALPAACRRSPARARAGGPRHLVEHGDAGADSQVEGRVRGG